MAAIDIDGGVPSTTLNGAITSGATSITVADGSSYPDGTNGNFYIVIDLGAAAEETIECSARSSNTLTVATRGADGTSAASHDNGATVQHVVPALTLQEANTHANQTTGTPHGSAYVTPSGNVATATALATGRNIVLSGDVSGTSGSFDGTANATITTTIADDSHNHTDSTITGTLSNDTTGNAATATALATARTIGGVSFDGTANINLPGVNAAGNQDTTGNATTATGLAAAVTIGGVSFDGTANINLPGVNTSGTQDTSGTAAVATTATLTDAGTDTTCFPVLAGAATGNEGLETDASALTYNASTGTLSATNLAGTLTTAAQANITSVGTLTGLTTSGTVGTAVVSVDDGSASAPSVTFTSDTGNGMYLSGTDELAFTTGGSQRVKITAGGVLQWIGSSAVGGPLSDTSSTSGFRYVLQNQTFGTLQDFTSIRDRKEQITNVTAADSGQWIDALQPVTFIERWLGEGDEPADNRTYREADVQVGFIADDVLSNSDTSLFAQATDNGEGGLDPAGWKWECVIAAAVAELKSVRARLAAIEGS